MFYDKLVIYIVTYFGLFTSILFFISFFENMSKLKNPLCKKFPKVTIAVPVYNGEKYLRKTVNSLLKLDYPKEKLEIIIVDDGSTDNSYNIAEEYIKKGVKVLTKENTGKGSSLNCALKIAKGDFFGCLDVDSIVKPNALKKMVGYFENRRVMAVTPSLKVYKAKSILQKIQMMEFLLGVYLRKIFSYFGSIHVTPGPFTIYRKTFFKKYGYYDENNLTEDIEIALRIQSRGYIIENAIDANVYTVGVKKFNPLLRQRLRWYKGFMDNVMGHKHLFSKKFGNLGLFILPGSFISIFLIITVFFYSSYKFFNSTYKWIAKLFAVNFDMISLFDFDIFFINLNSIMVIIIISLIAGIGTICLAKKYSVEKQKIKSPYVLFLALYWCVFAFWWVVAIFYKVTNKRIKWGNKYL